MSASNEGSFADSLATICSASTTTVAQECVLTSDKQDDSVSAQHEVDDAKLGSGENVSVKDDIHDQEISVVGDTGDMLEKPMVTIEEDEEYHSENSTEVSCGNQLEDVEAEQYDFSEVPLPEYELDQNNPPLQVTGSWRDFEQLPHNFLKGCKWSPDGTCILTNSEDHCLRVFNLPNVFYSDMFSWDDVEEMHAVLKMKESDLIYDYCWYPLMNSMDPISCCLVSSSRNGPVHMWDAFTGCLRCTYRPYNHVDEIVTPHSLAFDLQGRKLFCGFNKMIRIFDVAVPGREYDERPTNRNKDGQGGILSCIAFSPGSEAIYAVGSYSNTSTGPSVLTHQLLLGFTRPRPHSHSTWLEINGGLCTVLNTETIGLYSINSGTLLCLLTGQKKGVTHIIFSPDGTKLYSGGRNDSEILCWDIRNPGHILFTIRRVVTTNQRIYFDLSRDGKYLVSGNQNGVVCFWDTTATPIITDDSAILTPCQFYLAHSDCVNGVSFHPYKPILATASGQRKFPNCLDSDDEDEESILSYKNVTEENCLKLWWIGKNPVDDQCVEKHSES